MRRLPEGNEQRKEYTAIVNGLEQGTHMRTHLAQFREKYLAANKTWSPVATARTDRETMGKKDVVKEKPKTFKQLIDIYKSKKDARNVVKHLESAGKASVCKMLKKKVYMHPEHTLELSHVHENGFNKEQWQEEGSATPEEKNGLLCLQFATAQLGVTGRQRSREARLRRKRTAPQHLLSRRFPESSAMHWQPSWNIRTTPNTIPCRKS
jgi:hypothetical protein